MSTTEYWLNGIKYDIGTEGLEHAIDNNIALSFIANIARALYPYAKIPAALAVGLLDWDANAAVPTYGKWAGPGWGGGARTSEVKWAEPPCYNDSIKGLATNPNLNPESCYSLVDAICKTHDWNYYQAEKLSGLAKEAAIMTADIALLTSIASALVNHTYESPTGTYNNGTWTEKTYTGTFDTAEKWYVAKLVPSFIAKIALVDTTIEARHAIITILTSLQTDFDGIIFNDNLCIHQNDSTSKTNAWIVDLNSTLKPINVNILYGTGSTKAANVFELKDGNVIRINGGDKNDAIVIYGAKNSASMACTFEIAGGGGLDRYYLDKDYNYKLIDSGANEIYIEDDDGGWVRIDTLYKPEPTDNTWKSEDGSITLTGNTITLDTGNTIDLGAAFEDGAFGINLIPIPDTPTDPDAYHSITGDFAPADSDPDTEGIQIEYDDWGNIIHSGQPEPGRADALYDTPANDLLTGGKGNDFIVSGNGGNDWLIGGEGNDEITANDDVNTVVIEGGAGTDVIYGGSGNDKIFCHDCLYSELEEILQMKHLIADGETAESIDIRGDVASGGVYRPYGDDQILDGDDYIYGSNARDVLLGGTGKDLLAGGGGDDVILGDKALAYVDYDADWSFSIVDYGVSFENLGIYAPWPDDVKYALQDDDVIYAGTGNDYASGCGGADEIYGGNGDDTLVGDGPEADLPLEFHGADFIEGGGGDDLIFGEIGALGVNVDDNYYDNYYWEYYIAVNGTDYTPVITGLSGSYDLNAPASGNDVIYAGTGNDYICFMDNARGNNVAYVRNIIPFRQKIKHQKHHNKWRRFSQCENLRRLAA